MGMGGKRGVGEKGGLRKECLQERVGGREELYEGSLSFFLFFNMEGRGRSNNSSQKRGGGGESRPQESSGSILSFPEPTTGQPFPFPPCRIGCGAPAPSPTQTSPNQPAPRKTWGPTNQYGWAVKKKGERRRMNGFSFPLSLRTHLKSFFPSSSSFLSQIRQKQNRALS